MDAAGEVAQLDERLLGLAVRLADERAGELRVLGRLRAAERHRQRDEPLLRAVVQVALDPAALGVGRGDHAGARLLERADARRQALALARLEQQPRHRDLHGGDAAGEPRRGVQRTGAGGEVDAADGT